MAVRVRERQTGKRRTRTKNCGGLLYCPFLNPPCNSIFMDSRLCFLDEKFSTGVNWGPPHPAMDSAQRGWPSECGYPCIYSLITRMSSSGPWFTWSTFACQPTHAVHMFSHLEHPVPKIPDWRLSQRSMCNYCKNIVFLIGLPRDYFTDSYCGYQSL